MGPAILTAVLLTAVAAGPPRSLMVPASGPVSARLVGDFEAVDRAVLTLSAGFPRTLVPLVEALAAEVPVDLLVQRDAGKRHATRFVAALDPAVQARVTLLPHVVDSPWVRDYGPLQLRDEGGAVRWLDPLYAERPHDDAAPVRMGERAGVPVDPLSWSLDGGALVTDGEGRCISTFDYFQTHALPRGGARLGRDLLPAIGCTSLTFVPALIDEDTGHVDMFMQFLGATTLAVSSVDPAVDPDQALQLDATVGDLKAAWTRMGAELEIVRVPMGIDLSGDLLPYVNGIRVRDVFLMPAYHDAPSPTERRATEALAGAMPGVTIVRIPAAEMADLGGALHCAVLGLHTARPAP